MPTGNCLCVLQLLLLAIQPPGGDGGGGGRDGTMVAVFVNVVVANLVVRMLMLRPGPLGPTYNAESVCGFTVSVAL